MKNTLHLPIKKNWQMMIESLVKKEEYRAITDHWVRRLLSSAYEMEFQVLDEMITDLNNPTNRYGDVKELMSYFDVEYRDYDLIELRNGYGKKVPTTIAEFKGIEVKQGVKEWGAEEGKYYFAIKIGEIIKPCWQAT